MRTDQVCEPAAPSVAEGVLVEYEVLSKPLSCPQQSPNHCRLPSAFEFLLSLSVAWIHLGTAESHLLLGVRSPWLRLWPQSTPLNLSSWLLHLRSFHPCQQ